MNLRVKFKVKMCVLGRGRRNPALRGAMWADVESMDLTMVSVVGPDNRAEGVEIRDATRGDVHTRRGAGGDEGGNDVCIHRILGVREEHG